MKVICVDDERLLAEHVAKLCRELPGVEEAQAEDARARFEKACPDAEITMLQGNQPVYHYLISVE